MTTSGQRLIESARRLATECREDVRWNIAKARKAIAVGDVEEARWHLGRAKVCGVSTRTIGHGGRAGCNGPLAYPLIQQIHLLSTV